MIEIENKTVRRRDKRKWYVLGGIFVAVFLFSFLSNMFKDKSIDVDAANVAKFDPGYIISDYQMSNYNSMSESEIQRFLNSKNSCNDTNITKYTVGEKVSYFSESMPPRTWHVKNGHFVCMADENFNGESAAHIIYRAAQDYRINPQVLIVLLEKEQSLITDTFPHSGQYRSATGYGCPDTAACSSKYYGFKNQVRNAASLFRTVLDGGWTNYPLGNNYIQYNPSASCGGSVVNVRNLATSALYRYTPYQPNAATLGGWTDGCNAYGNLNFYKLFEDWFGGITTGGSLTGTYKNMVVPRLLYVKKNTRYVVPETGEIKWRSFGSFEYFTHLNYQGGNMCLSIGNNKNCYIYNDLEEIEVFESDRMAVPRMLVVKTDTKNINYENNMFGEVKKAGNRIVFDSKIMVNGELCLKVQETDTECTLYSALEELPVANYQGMAVPRYFSINNNAKLINTSTGISYAINNDKKLFFDKLVYWFGELCLNSSSIMDSNSCIEYGDLRELDSDGFESMAIPRFLKVSKNAILYDVENNKENSRYDSDTFLYFDKKTELNGKLCLSAYYGVCIEYDDLSEVENFVTMDYPRTIAVKKTAVYVDLEKGFRGQELVKNTSLDFVDKMYVNGNLCLRSREDANNNQYRCIMYDDLSE